MTSDLTSATPSSAPPEAPGGEFRTTRWTQVSRAKADSPEGRRALADLCDAYYEPVAAFLRCELRDADAAREMAHDFFAHNLAGGAVARAVKQIAQRKSFEF